jgi:hypothetical protein
MLTAGVERGGRLVEHDDVRLMQKEPGKGAASRPRTGLIPWRLLLKAIDEVLMPHALERLGNLLDALAVPIYPTLQ